MVASEEGHVEVVDTLLQHEASVDLQAKVHLILYLLLHLPTCIYMYVCFYFQNGGHSLMVASKKGHMEVVNKLL